MELCLLFSDEESLEESEDDQGDDDKEDGEDKDKEDKEDGEGGEGGEGGEEGITFFKFYDLLLNNRLSHIKKKVRTSRRFLAKLFDFRNLSLSIFWVKIVILPN